MIFEKFVCEDFFLYKKNTYVRTYLLISKNRSQLFASAVWQEFNLFIDYQIFKNTIPRNYPGFITRQSKQLITDVQLSYNTFYFSSTVLSNKTLLGFHFVSK